MARRKDFAKYLAELKGECPEEQVEQQGGRLKPSEPVEAIIDTSKASAVLRPLKRAAECVEEGLSRKVRFTGDPDRDEQILKGLSNRPIGPVDTKAGKRKRNKLYKVKKVKNQPKTLPAQDSATTTAGDDEPVPAPKEDRFVPKAVRNDRGELVYSDDNGQQHRASDDVVEGLPEESKFIPVGGTYNGLEVPEWKSEENIRQSARLGTTADEATKLNKLVKSLATRRRKRWAKIVKLGQEGAKARGEVEAEEEACWKGPKKRGQRKLAPQKEKLLLRSRVSMRMES